MVESNDSSRSFVAASKLMSRSKALTRIGRPYLVSPIWNQGLSSEVSMKLPSG